MEHRIENLGNWFKMMVFTLIYNGNAIQILEADLENLKREYELLRKENDQFRATPV